MMNPSRLASALIGPSVYWGLWLFALEPPVKAAEATDLRSAVKQMLDLGWEPSPTANYELDAYYDALHGETLRGESDWRVEYAYALAKMRQWQYSEAAEVADRLTANAEAEVAARSMLAWLLLLQKKYAAGLAQLEHWAAALPAGETLTEDERAQRREAIRRIGRMYGYLAGPAASTLSEFERESRYRRLARILSEEEMKLFDQESRAVAEQFLTRVDEKDRIVEETRRKAEEERARRLEELAAEQRLIAERLTELEKQRGAAEEELQAKLREFDDRDAPLRERYAALDAEASVLQRNLAYTNTDIFRIEEQLQFEEDPVVRDWLFADLARLSGRAASYSRNLTQLESTAASVQSERRAIAAEQRQVDTRYRKVLAENADQQQGLARQAKRNENEEQRLMRERPKTTGQARSLTAHARAFTTYVPFPFEDARHRLLESFTR